ncbi:DUF4199 domain-containing protein [Salinimicrobium sp. GXAS 041]|uniref:DUF4199 domain-containing protein n=1 Tax=Salinimicrobium sp. GXAS 041 TaxID=3400806 RepID=UPI003C76B45A
MEQSTAKSPGKFAVTYGVILGVILIFIAIIMYVTGMALEGKQWPMYIYYVIFPVVIIMAIKAYKKETGGFLSLSEALKTGVATAVISGLIFLIYNLLFNYVIEPTYAQQALDATRDQLLQAGTMTDEQIEATLKWVEWGSNPLIGSAIWLAFSAFLGLIYSLIAGLIMKQKRPYEA